MEFWVRVEMWKNVFENGTRIAPLYSSKLIAPVCHSELRQGSFSHNHEKETLTSHRVREKWSDRMMGRECEHSFSILMRSYSADVSESLILWHAQNERLLWESEHTIIWVSLRKSLDFLFFSHIVSLYFLPLCRIQNSSSLSLSESYLLSVSGSSLLSWTEIHLS